MLKIGIIGLPNVGKSLLFSLITKKKIEIANYPFSTIEPNIGIVPLPDQRLSKLANFYQTKKIVAPLIKFWDIAGLIKGSHLGEGMGNLFLSHIREATALVHVVRCFSHSEILHVNNEINPQKDWETIQLELTFADIQTIENQLIKIQKQKKSSSSAELIQKEKLLKTFLHLLKTDKKLFDQKWTLDDLKFLKSLNLLTLKKTLTLINIGETDFLNLKNNDQYQKFVNFLKNKKTSFLTISLFLEKLLSDINVNEANEMRKEYRSPKNIFDKFLQQSFQMMNLSVFFTVKSNEIRGWSFPNHFTAKDCAALIHTDFAKGFICCETVSFYDLMKYQTELEVKNAGLFRKEGQKYQVKDGDICYFLFNV